MTDQENNRVLVGLGSNIDPLPNIFKTLKKIRSRFEKVRISSFYQSKAVGAGREAADFVNGCLLITTELPPRSLKFDVFRPIEQEMGRIRTDDKNASRTIDIDILLYGSRIIEEQGLTIPDRELIERNYLLIPAQEIAGEMLFPLENKKLKEYTLGKEGLTLLKL